MPRALREVVYVDGLRTVFGKAGPQGLFWKTRADDMGVKIVRELLRRNPAIPPERIGDVGETVVPMSVFTDDGWKLAERDEFLRPDTTMEGLAGLRTPFRPGGRVTAGNSAGLTDGATACFLASEEAAAELGLEPRMRLVGYAFSGVEPELMGIGPIPATRRVLERAGLALDDVGLFELNEPFAIQVLTWCDE